MKTKELVRILRTMGYQLIRSNKHDIYSNGSKTVILPQQKVTNRHIAKDTLKLIQYPTMVGEVNYKGAL
jgi:predicted RNA binding protein YcfA (HicA-like mRNA interferase family)